MQNMFQEIIANQFIKAFANKFMVDYAHSLDPTYVPTLEWGTKYNRTEFIGGMHFGFVDNAGVLVATIAIVDCSLGRYVIAKSEGDAEFHKGLIESTQIADIAELALDRLYEALTKYE